MKNSNYITLFGWMMNDLGLKGNPLLVYAVIYGFSQDGISWYTGGNSYLRKSLNISKRAVVNILQDLEDKGLIIRSVEYTKSMQLNKFKVNLCKIIGGAESAPLGVQKVHLGGAESALRGGAESAHNNTIINNTNYSESRALDFFKKESPSRFESWLMKYQKRIKEFAKFKDHFNNKFDEEDKKYSVKIIEARLNRFADNWIAFEIKNNSEETEKDVPPKKWS